MMREYRVLQLLSALHRTATATGTGVDLQNYIHPGHREMKATLDVGAVTSSASPEDTTLDVKIQESDTEGSGYTDITGATFTQVTSAGSVTTESIHFQTVQRYVRAVGTQAGTTDTVDYGVSLVAVALLT